MVNVTFCFIGYLLVRLERPGLAMRGGYHLLPYRHREIVRTGQRSIYAAPLACREPFPPLRFTTGGGLEYLGEWHSHPEGADAAGNKDNRKALTLLTLLSEVMTEDARRRSC